MVDPTRVQKWVSESHAAVSDPTRVQKWVSGGHALVPHPM